MKKLSIIIPHHKETLEQVDTLFSSLNAQIGVHWKDIEIIVCNDTDDEQTLDFSRYNTIKDIVKNVITPTKNNPGLSRQYGVDIATGKFIMMCDCDDGLYSILTLQEAHKMIDETPGGDIYKFAIIEQNPNQIDVFRINQGNNIWVYGRIYLKDYLVKNNIRFSDKLMFSEDVYYTMMLDLNKGKQYQAQTPLYIRKSNAESITGSDNTAYLYKGVIVDHVHAVDQAIQDITNEGKYTLDYFNQTIANMEMFYFVKYNYIYDQRGYGNTHKEYKKIAMDTMREFTLKYDPELSYLHKYFNKNAYESKCQEEGLNPKKVRRDIFTFYENLVK